MDIAFFTNSAPGSNLHTKHHFIFWNYSYMEINFLTHRSSQTEMKTYSRISEICYSPSI